MGRELLEGVKKKDLYFKILKAGGKAPNQSNFKWPKVGKWTTPIRGHLKLCFNGYHLARPRELFNWLDRYSPIGAPAYHSAYSHYGKKISRRLSIYVAEAKGARLTSSPTSYDGKICCQQARLLFRVPWNADIRCQLVEEIKRIDTSKYNSYTLYGEDSSKSIHQAFNRFTLPQRRRLMRKLFGIWNLKLGKSRRGEAPPTPNIIY